MIEPAKSPPSDELPGLLSEIASVVGRDAALKIAEARGGTTAYFPGTPRDDRHWLVVLIGREAADRLCRHLSGGRGARLTIPSGSTSHHYQARRERRDIIGADLSAGLSVREIALKHRMSERRVRCHKASNRKG